MDNTHGGAIFRALPVEGGAVQAIEETDHRQGKVVDETHLTIAKDGNTIVGTVRS